MTDTLQEQQAASHAASEAYVPGNVQILRDAAHIRQRPGMYIGDTTSNGLHHLVYELVYNSVDEALAGFCNTIHVIIDVDGSLSVSDDGRGIPVDVHPDVGKSTLEVVMTTVGAGAKFDKRTYKTSAGLHGMGAKAVTALSDWTEARVQRNGRVYVQEYERGKPITEVKDIGASDGRTGTRVTFQPDPQIFHDATFNADTLESRFRELAFLNKGLGIKFTDMRNGHEELFKADGGLAEFVQYLNRLEEPLHGVIYVDKTVDEIRVEAAIQYTTSEDERVRCYTNNAYNPVGGTHFSGFRSALTRALKTYGDKTKAFKENLEPINEDFRKGVTAVVSVQVPEPQFESNSKLKLNNPEVEGVVTSVVHEALTRFLEENPKDAKRIMSKAALEAEAREAAAKAKKAVQARKSILSGGGLPGKLMDCLTRNLDESELFLVEGQSAGGTAESGRDRNFQAILPLRGKVLNVEKARVEKVLANEEICNLISAIGVDIGNAEEVSKRRYGKIILLTDADVDGQHIRTLLLTFFYRQMRRLIEDGFIYVARPPLYKVTQKKNVRFVQKIEEMNAELMRRGLDNTQLHITLPDREPVTFAGQRLADLVQVLGELEDPLLILERRGISLNTFLTRASAQGLPMFHVLFGGHDEWLHSAAEVDAFRQTQQARLGHDLVIGDEWRAKASHGNGAAPAPSETFFVQELHEVRYINRGLERLKPFNLGGPDLLPLPRIAGREPPLRYTLQHDDSRRELLHLRNLAAEARHLGEKGLQVTRFKGLGEMDADELWETTLDPTKRTLAQVKLDDALKAEEMFRTLMGEKVEPRRDFIQKHALEVKDVDYHGA